MNMLAVMIIEAFEDFLDERGIVIENSEKQDAIDDGEAPESICNIYGSDFGDLMDAIENILKDEVDHTSGVC